MKYYPDPDKKYDRFMRDDFGGNVVIEMSNGIQIPLSKNEYKRIIQTFGETMGFIPMHSQVIKKRLE